MVAVYAVVIAMASAGCTSSGPPRLTPPPLDPGRVTAALFEQADADGNGLLSGGELKVVPALAGMLTRCDTNRDAALSRDELTAWLDDVRTSRVAISTAMVAVQQNGRPVADVLVRFIPEPCMGTGIPPAEGRTDRDGNVLVTIPESKYPGLNCGIYRVEITGNGFDGKPLPARFNSDSRLGAAIGGGLPDEIVTVFSLD